MTTSAPEPSRAARAAQDPEPHSGSVESVRQARRAWVAAHHPDRGGDRAAFEAGLAHFTRLLDEASGQRPALGHRPAVYRSRSPARRVQLLLRQWRRRRRGQPPRTLQ